VRWSWQVVEATGLVSASLVGVLAVLGRAAERLSGIGTWDNLVPFAAVVLLLATVVAAVFWAWMSARRWLTSRAAWAPAVLASALGIGAGWLSTGPEFERDLASVRALLGGRAEAERRAIAHQVFAAYRRTPVDSWQQMLERARVHEANVREAAAAFRLDPEVLMGVGAAESAFLPRDSADGGRGLFQITSPPAAAVEATQIVLRVRVVDPVQHRHNAYLAAATLREYLNQMEGDLFLGLLAYNIGPSNGGLRSIMEQYGARDFVTIQPYLQHLPRDYPIRVLAAALAYRLWRLEGRLLRYEEGANAGLIQRIGVPGL
jgi:soluble lytic murein transglycosylase-like protein